MYYVYLQNGGPRLMKIVNCQVIDIFLPYIIAFIFTHLFFFHSLIVYFIPGHISYFSQTLKILRRWT
jgi:hypothetical protein